MIPKSENPQSLEEYRPISLVGCLYNQLFFISNRGLLDSVLVVNEVVDELRRERRSGVIVKLDYENAYESVNCQFLFDMMGRLGFWGKDTVD